MTSDHLPAGPGPGRRALPARRALVDDVYDAVLGLLMDRVLEPGARVNIDAVARELDVSPTPVREALTRLEAEGLVAKRALKGYVAAPLLDAAGLRDLFDMRRLLEPEAARRAAALAAATVHDELQGSVTRMASAAASTHDDERYRDYRRFIEEDLAFHHLVAEASGSPLLLDAITRLKAHMHLYRLDFRHDFADDTVHEHELVLEALRARDATAAARAMRAHIDRSADRLEAAIAGPEHTRPGSA
jgi:DNA-binding GntR family transcriptional regulator